MMQAPHARYRLYTSWRSYLPFLVGLLPGAGRKDAKLLFEERLRAFLRTPAVATVPMCRTGIYLAVKHTIRPGQDVVMSPYTIADVVNMVILAGGRPVFADIDRATCNLRTATLARLLRSDTGAVLVTHLHGIPAPIEEVCELCAPRGIPVIEDAAQAFGATVQGRRLGTYGDIGVFSFGLYKNLNAWYGGAITSRDPAVCAAISKEAASFPLQGRSLLFRRMLQGLITDLSTHPFLFRLMTFWIFRQGRLHDIRWINRFVETELDLNRLDSMPEHYRRNMTTAQCQLALLQLGHIDRDNARRAENAARYRMGLAGSDTYLLPPDAPGAMYTYFPVQAGEGPLDRQRLLKHLSRWGCDIGPQHLKNCADLPAFREYFRDCPDARRTADAVVLLPTYPSYPVRDIDRTIAVLQDYAESRMPRSKSKLETGIRTEVVQKTT